MSAEDSNFLHKVECTLKEKKPKPNTKRDLLTNLIELHINDEQDLKSISYVVSKEDGLVYKVILNFKDKSNSEAFVNFVNNDENRKKHNFCDTITETVENRRKLSVSTTSESILVIEDDNYQESEFSDKTFTIETSIYDKEMLEKDTNNISSWMHSSSISTNTNKNYNEEFARSKAELTSSTVSSKLSGLNVVEFCLSKPLEKESELEKIILYLENLKSSGGGDIDKYHIDEQTKRTLIVHYSSPKAKERVLKKHIHLFQDYKLIANEPFEDSKFPLNNRVLLIRNLNKEDDEELIRIYCENLVINDNEDNDVDSIEFSSMFNETVYVRFKLDFEYEDKVVKRIARKPVLNQKKLEFCRAYKTNTLLVKQFDRNNEKIQQDLIELYFSNKKRSGVESFSSIHVKEPFILVKFDKEDQCDKVLATKHTVSKHELIIEPLYNFELLNEEIVAFQNKDENHNKFKVKNKNEVNALKAEKETVKTVKNIVSIKSAPSIENVSKSQAVKKISESKSEAELKPVENVEMEEDFSVQDEQEQKVEEPLPRPSIQVNINDEPMLRILQYFDNIYFDQLSTELMDREGGLFKLKDDFSEIRVQCSLELPSNKQEHEHVKAKWEEEIRAYLKEFFSQFDLKLVKILHKSILTNELVEKDRSRLSLRPVENQADIFVELCGFKDLVADMAARLDQENKLYLQKQNAVTTVQLKNFKVSEIRVLFVNKFIMNMKEKHKTLVITMNAKNGTIDMKGTPTQIDDAKIELNKIINSILNKDVQLASLAIRFLKQKEFEVVNFLREKNNLCALDIDTQSNKVTIYSTDKTQMENCAKILEADIVMSDLSDQVRKKDEEMVCEAIKGVCENIGGCIYEYTNRNLFLSGFRQQVDLASKQFQNTLN